MLIKDPRAPSPPLPERINFELGAKLAAALGLPKNTIDFNLRFRLRKLPTVTCRYYPEPLTIGADDKLVEEIKHYTLTPRCADE
jgi:hypothetical protein